MALNGFNYLYHMVNYVDKMRVYINSVELSALDLVNVNTLGHGCDNPSARISAGLRNMPEVSSGLISGEERKTIEIVEQFSEENGLKYEIIDLAKAGSMTRLKFMMRGWKTPAVSYANEAIVGLPTREQLESFIRRRRAQ
jgi:hypothetical protein